MKNNSNEYDEYDEDVDFDYELDWDLDALSKHKRTDKFKWIITAVSIMLITVLLIGLCLQVFGTGKVKPSEWGKSDADDEQAEQDNTVIATMAKLISTRIQREQFEEYGINPQADSAYTLMATVTPNNADDKTVTWSIAWRESDAWADNKDISEYIALSSTTDNPVAVACLKPFGTQAVITCASNNNSELTATCTVDYKQKLESIVPTIKVNSADHVLSLEPPVLPIADSAKLNVAVNKTTGSIAENYAVTTTVKFTDECIEWLENIYDRWGTGYDNQATIDVDGNFSIAYLLSEDNPDCLFIPNKSGGIYGSSAGSMYFYEYLLPEFNTQTFPKLLFTVTLTDGLGNATTYEYKAKLDRLTIAALGLSLNSNGLIF